MAREKLHDAGIFSDNITDLSAVTSATDGSGLKVAEYSQVTVFVNVSVNSGAVTVSVEASPDNATWFSIDSKTYTAVTGKDTFSYGYEHFPYIRTTTTTQSASTVTTSITART
tara:strand:+ start:514 stop:852 length:339 start_codon:yes stop_codon:yes gene_type:complete